MKKLDSFLEKQSNTRLEHLLKGNEDQIPAMIQLTKQIKQEYLQVQKSDGQFAAVLSVYKTADSYYEEAIAETTHPVSCLNCTAAYCCHMNVEICEAEAKLIAAYCKQHNIPISRAYLQEQLKYSRDKIAQADCSACVFLKDKRCGIYPVRPFNCRTHFAATPIEDCDTKNNKGGRIGMLPMTAADIVGSVLFLEGGKHGRMPKMLIKYSK